jgi:hypothetical protein
VAHNEPRARMSIRLARMVVLLVANMVLTPSLSNAVPMDCIPVCQRRCIQDRDKAYNHLYNHAYMTWHLSASPLR